MARNRSPKQRREARRRAAEARPTIHVKHSPRGGLNRQAIFAGHKERENAVRFYRFLGVAWEGGLEVSDTINEWSRIDELYAGMGRRLRGKLEASKFKKLRRRILAAGVHA